MRFEISTIVLGMSVGIASAGGDIIIDFPGILRPRASAAASSVNLFAFSSALGGQAAEPVTSTGDSTRPFAVGSETFTDFKTAATRSCNDQHNACAKVANSGSSSNGGLTVGDCDAQQTNCTNAAANGPSTSNSNSNTVSTTTSSTSIASIAESAAAAQSTTATTSSSLVVVQSSTSTTSAFAVQGTLHSSDDQFLFFCD